MEIRFAHLSDPPCNYFLMYYSYFSISVSKDPFKLAQVLFNTRSMLYFYYGFIAISILSLPWLIGGFHFDTPEEDQVLKERERGVRSTINAMYYRLLHRLTMRRHLAVVVVERLCNKCLALYLASEDERTSEVSRGVPDPMLASLHDYTWSTDARA